MDNLDLEKMLTEKMQEALAKALSSVTPPAATPAAEQPEMVSKADVEAMLASLKSEMTELVTKALPAREEGAGRKGELTPAEPTLEDSPAEYLIMKAGRIKDESEWTADEKAVIAGITFDVLAMGLKG